MFTPNLKSTLTNSKPKLLQNSYPGMCQLSCNYGGYYIEGAKKASVYTIHRAPR